MHLISIANIQISTIPNSLIGRKYCTCLLVDVFLFNSGKVDLIPVDDDETLELT